MALSGQAKRDYAKRYRMDMLMLDPDFDKKRTSRRKAKNPAAYLLKGARANARRKGLDFDLDESWYHQTDAGHCSESRIKWDFNRYGGTKAPFAPSIDRIDSSKGYTKDNCRLVCWAVNNAMADHTDDVFWTMVTSANAHVPDEYKPSTESVGCY